ncbi:AAA family ATPase [Bacillota bacterium LX-D]|nr:AAA family ATPase [Bacillota bacterium LX-D]
MTKPFSRQIDPSDLYESLAHREALARLQLMVENRYLGLLTGEVGSGKSTLIRRLFQNLDPVRYLPIYISSASLKPRDFYGELLRHVGEVPPFSLAKAKRLWADVLEARQEQAEKALVVVVHEAQEMSEAMLGELRFVVSYQMDSCSLFPLILVGQPELRRTLRLKKYEAIAQRITLQYHLGGLSPEETAHYIRHQMKTAGMAIPVFSESAMALVHATSQGIPRIINQICSQALYDAAQRGHEVIEESHIARVLADFDRQRGVAG